MGNRSSIGDGTIIIGTGGQLITSGGTIITRAGNLNNGRDGAVGGGGVTIRAVPAPSSILLLLPGLILLARGSWRRAGQ